MNKRQRESTAKYLYDISKIVFAGIVIGQLVKPEEFSGWIFIGGVLTSLLFFIWAYLVEEKE